MSVALDTALFLREQELIKPLTLAERGVLFTLMFRVGSNPYTWVSQNDLCIELDITERPLRKHLKSLEEKGFLISMGDINDKRKNVYRPAEFLINYHQNSKRNPSKSYPQKRSCTRNYRSKTAGIIRDTGQKQPVFTGQKQPVISCTNHSEPIENTNEKSIKTLPKDKYKTKALKQKRDFFVNKNENQKHSLQNKWCENERQVGLMHIANIKLKLGKTG